MGGTRASSARRRGAGSLGLLASLWALGVAVAAEAPDPTGEQPPDLAVAAPYLAQLVQLAALDPVLAASLVPEPWIDALLEAARAVEAERPGSPGQPDPPHQGPIGPWASPASLAASIEALDPRAVASLYRALAPRTRARCRAGGASFEICEQALRASALRLSAPSVLERARGGQAGAITPTQRELARLGIPVVVAVRLQTRALGSLLWGTSWSASR